MGLFLMIGICIIILIVAFALLDARDDANSQFMSLDKDNREDEYK